MRHTEVFDGRDKESALSSALSERRLARHVDNGPTSVLDFLQHRKTASPITVGVFKLASLTPTPKVA